MVAGSGCTDFRPAQACLLDTPLDIFGAKPGHAIADTMELDILFYSMDYNVKIKLLLVIMGKGNITA